MFFKIVLTFIFILLVVIVISGDILYPSITRRLKKNFIKKIKKLPKITIIIPAYNEEKSIESKIRNTLSIDYPKQKMKVIIIDNDSSDDTFKLASRFPIKVLKSKRGKINALNAGLEYSKTDIIIMTDADVELDRSSIRSMVSYLHGKVGAVNGYVVPKSIDTSSLIKEKIKYKKKDWKLRYQESMIDSVCNLDGKLIAFRKSVFNRFPENALTDDYTMTFNIRSMGYRAVVDKDAKVYENIEENAKSEIKQFERYATDVIITNFKNINFLFNPKYGYFGMMTFPFRRFFPLFYPIFFLYILGYLGFVNPLIPLSLFPLGFLFLLIFQRLKLIRIFAIMLSYFNLRERSLKSGSWSTIRK